MEDNEISKFELITIAEQINDFRQEYFASRCAICDKELSTEEISSITPTDFNYTCYTHRDLSGVFQVPEIRKRMGIDGYKTMFEFLEDNI